MPRGGRRENAGRKARKHTMGFLSFRYTEEVAMALNTMLTRIQERYNLNRRETIQKIIADTYTREREGDCIPNES